MMHKFFTFILVLFCSLSLHFCDKRQQILASYEYKGKVHSITREELRWLAQLQGFYRANRKQPKISTQEQHRLLKEYAFAQLIAQLSEETKSDLQKEDLRKSKPFQDATLLANEKAQLRAYQFYLQSRHDDASFDFLELQIIILPNNAASSAPVSSNPNQNTNETKPDTSTSPEVVALLQELNSGKLSVAQIEEKVREYSQHPLYRQQGGYIDPVCTSCVAVNAFDFMQEKLDQAKVGKFFEVIQERAIWLVRIIRKYSCDADEVEEEHERFYRTVSQVARRFGAKAPSPKSPTLRQADRGASALTQTQIESLAAQKSQWFIEQHYRNRLHIKLKKLKRAHKFIAHDAGIGQPKQVKKTAVYQPDAKLYTIDDKTFTYSMFLKKYPALSEQDIKQQMYALQQLLIPLALLRNETDFQEAQKSKLFTFIKNFIQTRALTLAYYKQAESEIKIPASQSKAFYETEKQRHYTGVSYAKVQQEIEVELKRKQFNEYIQKMQTVWAERHKLTIQNDLLEPDKI